MRNLKKIHHTTPQNLKPEGTENSGTIGALYTKGYPGYHPNYNVGEPHRAPLKYVGEPHRAPLKSHPAAEWRQPQYSCWVKANALRLRCLSRPFRLCWNGW